jgi:hypothetical protein
MSNAVTHPALVTERDFVAAQQVRAERATADGEKRTYLLRGLLRCGHCGRRMDAHWVHQRAGYRCRLGVREADNGGEATAPGPTLANLYAAIDLQVRDEPAANAADVGIRLGRRVNSAGVRGARWAHAPRRGRHSSAVEQTGTLLRLTSDRWLRRSRCRRIITPTPPWSCRAWRAPRPALLPREVGAAGSQQPIAIRSTTLTGDPWPYSVVPLVSPAQRTSP